MNKERYHIIEPIIQLLLGVFLAFGMTVSTVLSVLDKEHSFTDIIFWGGLAFLGITISVISLYRIIRKPIKIYEGYLMPTQKKNQGSFGLGFRFKSSTDSLKSNIYLSVPNVLFSYVHPLEFREGVKYRIYYDPIFCFIMEKEVLEKKKRKIYINNLQ